MRWLRGGCIARRGDVDHRRDLEVVERLDTGAVAGAEQRLRQWAKFVACTDIVPADAKRIAALLIEWTVPTDTGAQEVANRRGVAVADRGSPEQPIAPFFLAPELDQILIEARVDCVGIRKCRKAGTVGSG